MFARKVNVFILRTGIVGVLNLATLYFTGHYIGPEAMGLIGFSASFIQMFFLFSELGIGQAHIKRISEGKDISKCIGTYFFLKGSIITGLTLLVVAFLLVKKYYFNSSFSDPRQETVIYLLLGPMILAQLSTIPLYTFEAKKEAIKTSLPLILAPLAKTPVIIIVALMGYGVYGLVFARYISGLVILIAAFVLLRHPIKRPDMKFIKSYFSYAYKAFVLFILVQASLQIDKLMIGKFVSIKAVGLYVSVLSIVAILGVIPNAVGSLLFPTISEENSKGNTEKIREYTHKSEKYITMVMLPITVLIAFFSKSIILILLGENFTDASIPLTILSFYILVNGMRKPAASLLAGTEKIGLLATMSTISVIVLIILNLLLIPKELFGVRLAGFGIVGAAIATLSSGLLNSLLCRITAFRTTGIGAYKKLYIQYLAGIMMFAFLFLMNRLYPVSDLPLFRMIFIISAYSLTALVLFVVVLVIFKEFTKTEMNMITKSLNPGKMKEYFKSEMKD